MTFEIVVKGDYGHLLKILVKDYDETTGTSSVADISGFTTRQFVIKKPDGTTTTKNANFTTDGTDGYMEATVLSADEIFDQKGVYEIQGLLQNATQKFHTSIFIYDVQNPLA